MSLRLALAAALVAAASAAQPMTYTMPLRSEHFQNLPQEEQAAQLALTAQLKAAAAAADFDLVVSLIEKGAQVDFSDHAALQSVATVLVPARGKANGKDVDGLLKQAIRHAFRELAARDRPRRTPHNAANVTLVNLRPYAMTNSIANKDTADVAGDVRGAWWCWCWWWWWWWWWWC